MQFLTNPTFLDALKVHKRSFQAGNIIKLEGDDSGTTYMVLSGWLAVSKAMEDGDKQIIDFILPGEIIDPSSADPATVAVQVEAISHAAVSVMPAPVWTTLCEASEELRLFENRYYFGVLSRMAERMLRLGKGSAETRIAYALIELWLRLHAPGGEGEPAFRIPLTQQQLGEFVGLSSVHVCRTMRRLVTRGIISMHDHMSITIHDMDSLSEIAGIDPQSLAKAILPGKWPSM